MAEIITAKGSGFFIEKVIRGARERIVLISPFLKVQKLYLDELKSAAKKGIPVTVLFREKEATLEQLGALREVQNIMLICLPELHAKCYFNEHRFVLTSMNLHDHSERNNKELGIMLEKEKDGLLFDQALDHALRVLENGKPMASTRASVSAPPIKATSKTSSSDSWVQRVGRLQQQPEGLIVDAQLIRIRKEHPRAYFSWTSEEDELLLEMSNCGLTMKEVSGILRRQPSALQSRLSGLRAGFR